MSDTLERPHQITIPIYDAANSGVLTKRTVLAWPTVAPGLVVVWNAGTWSVTHEPTGRAVMPSAMGACCLRHARNWVEDVAGADWTVSYDEMAASRDTYKPLIDAAGGGWQCGDWEYRLTAEEAAEILAHDDEVPLTVPEVLAVIKAGRRLMALDTTVVESDPF